MDVGCGSGRWAKILADKVKYLTLLDPSTKALKISKKNLKGKKNVSFVKQSVGEMKFKNKFDFVYSLGVAILAYPSIGTPFIDHHAVIFCILACFSVSLAILLKKNF